MLYVDKSSHKIMSERQYLRHHKMMRSQPLRQEDLDDLNGAELQPDALPGGDHVRLLGTASPAEDGLWYRDYEVIAFTADELLQYKASSIQQISAEFDRKINEQIAVYYPQFERDSWPDQRKESEAWVSYIESGGIEPVTPILDVLVQDNESKTDYANKILTNAESFKVMAAQHLKNLRGIRSAIELATNKAEIDAQVVLAAGS